MIPEQWNTFQTVAVAVFAIFLIRSIFILAKGRIRIAEGVVRIAVSLVACAAILNPSALTRMARTVGIGRGTDLVVYLAVIAMLAGFWFLYIRLRQIRREITILVRHQALQSAGMANPAGLVDPSPDSDQKTDDR
ncbi:MAG: DUF2304 family protein [Planctomycetota bacterium]|jgi:hypothetical protein